MRNYLLLSKALADETRIRILKLLEQKELCVCQVMAALDMGQSTVSKHLAILKNASLIEARREGTWAYYRLAGEGSPVGTAEFLDLSSKVLNKDPRILSDRKRLKSVLSQDVATMCRVGKGK